MDEITDHNIDAMPIDKRRHFAILAHEKGMGKLEACEKFKISKNSFSRYWKRYQREGEEGLKNRNRSRTGKEYRSPMTDEAKVTVQEIIILGKYQRNVPSLHYGIWQRGEDVKLNKICSALNTNLGYTYSESSISRYLNKSGLKECRTELQGIVKEYTTEFKKIESLSKASDNLSRSERERKEDENKEHLQNSTREKLISCRKKWTLEFGLTDEDA
jgi:transposase